MNLSILTTNGLGTFWAIYSQAHLVALQPRLNRSGFSEPFSRVAFPRANPAVTRIGDCIS
jgi:hypothetical protein